MLHFYENNNISLQISDFEIIKEINSNVGATIRMLKHKVLGHVLIINDEIQHIEAWAPMYHEHIIHLPIAFIPSVKKVLILGGGSFFAAKELLKYQSIEKIVMVDHDNSVISLVSEIYDHAQEVQKDERFSLIIDDLSSYLELCNDQFDLIVNDAIDIIDFQSNLFMIITSKLSDVGICSDLVYRNIYESDKSMKTISILREKYSSAFSLVAVPEYPGILHLLSMWGRTKYLNQHSNKLQNSIQQKWIQERNPCQFYDPRFLNYYLYLPPYLKKYILNI